MKTRARGSVNAYAQDSWDELPKLKNEIYRLFSANELHGKCSVYKQYTSNTVDIPACLLQLVDDAKERFVWEDEDIKADVITDFRIIVNTGFKENSAVIPRPSDNCLHRIMYNFGNAEVFFFEDVGRMGQKFNDIMKEVNKDMNKDEKERKKIYQEARLGLMDWIIINNNYGSFSIYPEQDRTLKYVTHHYGLEEYIKKGYAKILRKEALNKLLKLERERKEAQKRFNNFLKREFNLK